MPTLAKFGDEREIVVVPDASSKPHLAPRPAIVPVIIALIGGLAAGYLLAATGDAEPAGKRLSPTAIAPAATAAPSPNDLGGPTLETFVEGISGTLYAGADAGGRQLLTWPAQEGAQRSPLSPGRWSHRLDAAQRRAGALGPSGGSPLPSLYLGTWPTLRPAAIGHQLLLAPHRARSPGLGAAGG